MTENGPGKQTANSGIDEGDAVLDWRGYLESVRKRLWLVFLLVAAGTLSSMYSIEKAVPVYASRCTVSVERQDRVLSKIEAVKSDLADNSWTATLVETMKSRTIMDRLAQRLSAGSAAKVGVPALIVTNRPGTMFIDVVAESTDPEVAALWANGLVDEYQKFRMETVSKSTATANQFLLDEATRITEKLTVSELALQDYREKKNAISLEKDQDVVISRFHELSTQFNLAKDKRIRIEADLANADKLGDKAAELAQLTSVAVQPGVVAAQAALSGTEGEMAVLKQRYGPKHPKYKALQTELDIHKQALATSLIAAAKSLKDAAQEAIAQERRLGEEMADQEKKTYELGKLQVNYDKLKREIDAGKVIYEQVLGRLKETDVAKGLEGVQNSPLKIIEGATASNVPVRPDKHKMLFTGIFGGFGIGIALALGLHLLDSSIHTVQEAENQLQLPVLAAIATRKKIPADWDTLPKLDTIHHQHGPISEAFRTLRSSLFLLGRGAERKIILGTSAVPGEGKSFTACNLAVTFAQQGLRTLLIDLDLRRPTIGKAFFAAEPAMGASDVLSGQMPFSQAVSKSPQSGLDILTAGSRAPNPSELLGTGSLPTLLKELRSMYDLIIIDSAPVIAVSDPLLVAPMADTILQVVRSNWTPASAAKRACQLLAKSAGRPVSGIVVNQLPLNSRGYYYYYHSGYYGGKGVYGAPA